MGVPVEVGAPTPRSLSRSDNLTRKAETRVDFALLPTKNLENVSSQKFYNLCIAHKNQPKKPSDKIFVKIPQSLVIQGFIGFLRSREIHKFCVHFTKNGGRTLLFVHIDKIKKRIII